MDATNAGRSKGLCMHRYHRRATATVMLRIFNETMLSSGVQIPNITNLFYPPHHPSLHPSPHPGPPPPPPPHHHHHHHHHRRHHRRYVNVISTTIMLAVHDCGCGVQPPFGLKFFHLTDQAFDLLLLASLSISQGYMTYFDYLILFMYM